jgi:hypothetical protein
MATFSGVCEAGAGSATLPFAGIYAGASTRLIVREIKCFTTAANAARIRIQRATTAGTWTGEEEIEQWEDGPPPDGIIVVTATSTAPTMGSPVDVGAIGGAVASGFHYTYYGEGRGLVIPSGAGNGIVLIENADTANTYDTVWVWDE